MRIVIRTDASLDIGSGHVMRCLSLAGELRKLGAEVCFICREHPGNLCEFIEEQGYQLVRLATSTDKYYSVSGDPLHASWLVVPWQQDADETVATLSTVNVDWLIVDHYSLDRRWEKRLQPSIGKIMVIDDLADRSHDCDLLLDQNLYDDMDVRYQKLVPNTCRALLGPHYALLRQEFREARKELRERDGLVRRILIFFGGVDPTNETFKTIHAYRQLNRQDIMLDVVVGGSNPRQEEIKLLCESIPQATYHCQVSNMAELMARADLAVGAGGSSTWERCCLGVPSIVSSIAMNQAALAQTAAHYGVCVFMGDARNTTEAMIAQQLKDIIKDRTTLNEITLKGMALVDGMGVERVITTIMECR